MIKREWFKTRVMDETHPERVFSEVIPMHPDTTDILTEIKFCCVSHVDTGHAKKNPEVKKQYEEENIRKIWYEVYGELIHAICEMEAPVLMECRNPLVREQYVHIFELLTLPKLEKP